MGYTPYSKTEWDENVPISVDNLNNLENGIKALESNTIFYEELGTIDETTGEITLNSNNSSTTNNEEE